MECKGDQKMKNKEIEERIKKCINFARHEELDSMIENGETTVKEVNKIAELLLKTGGSKMGMVKINETIIYEESLRLLACDAYDIAKKNNSKLKDILQQAKYKPLTDYYSYDSIIFISSLATRRSKNV